MPCNETRQGTDRAVKLGVTPWNLTDRSARGLAEQARAAETMGYDSFWLPENHFDQSAIPEPLMLLAAVAAGTETIRLATTSYLLPLRNPLQAAEQVAVLDQLSGGRVLLGVGRGYATAMLKAFDVVPAEKRRVFERSLEVMRLAWSGQPVVLADGTQVTLDPLPVQRPHPPVWVAAFGPKALAQAGRLGLPYLASPMETLDTLTTNYRIHADAAVAAGHRPMATVPLMRTIFVSSDARQVRGLRRRIGAQPPPAGRQAAPEKVDHWCIVGDEYYVTDRIGEYLERFGVNHLVVTRMRIPGVDERAVRRSLEKVRDIVGRVG